MANIAQLYRLEVACHTSVMLGTRSRFATHLLSGALSLGLLGVGCGDDEFVAQVDVRTDLIPSLEFDEVTVERLGAVDDIESASADEDWTQTQPVGEWELPEGDYVFEITAKLDGRDVVERRAQVSLTTSKSFTVLLTRDCRGVECPGEGDSPSETACLGGSCVDPACLTGEEEICGDIEASCGSTSECDPLAASCASPVCEGGLCLAAISPSACETGQLCSPDDGCVGGPPPMMSDAGPDVGEDTDPEDVGPDVPTDPTPGCNDGERNNDEDGIDCGGDCRDACYSEGTGGFGKNLVLYGGTLFHLWTSVGNGGSRETVVRLGRSTDRGESWEQSIVARLPATRSNALLVSGDLATPTVRVLLSHSVGDGSEGVFVVTSTDGGVSFGEAEHVSAATDVIDPDESGTRPVSFPASAAAVSSDLITVAWTDYSPDVHPRGNGVWDVFFASSSDGGASWNDARQIHQDSRPWVDPLSIATEDQNVWVAVPLNVGAGHDLSVFRSTDGGDTFAGALLAVPAPPTGGNARTPEIVRVGSTLHIVYSLNRASTSLIEIGYVRSVDDGMSWTAHSRVSDEGVRFKEDGVGHYRGAPQLHVLADGRLVVVWVDERLSDDTTTRWAPQYSVSGDGGVTWSPDTLIRAGDEELSFSSQSVVFEEAGSAELVVLHNARTPRVANTSRLVRTSVSLD